MTPAPNSSVLGGMLAHVSASQIKQHEECPRAWYANKVLGLPQEESANLNLGTALHSQVEALLRKTVKFNDPAYPSVAQLFQTPSFPYIPEDDATRGMFIEWPNDYGLKVRAAQVRIKGRMDALLTFTNGDAPIVYDWKSTSSITSWAKSPEELERDIQLNIYGMEVVNVFGAQHVRYAHGYMQTHAKKAEPHPKGFKGKAKIVITDPIPAARITSFFNDIIEPAVERMKVSAQVESILDLTPNWGHCNAYNKQCPYWSVCTDRKVKSFLPEEVSTTLTPEETMTLKEKLAQRIAVTSSTPAAQAVVDAPVVGTATFTAYAQGINPPDAAKPEVAVKYVPTYTPPDAELDKAVAFVSGAVVEKAADTTSVSDIIYTAHEAAKKAGGFQGLTLFVDCVPTQGDTVWSDFGEWVSFKASEVASTYKVTDVRQVEFGKGTAALVAACLNDIPTGWWTCSSAGLSGLVVEALAPRASLVVRGLR